MFLFLFLFLLSSIHLQSTVVYGERRDRSISWLNGERRNRSISWWWSSPATADDPGVDGLLNFVSNNTDIVSSVMMRCGVYTCLRNESSARPHATCLNNHGMGGKVTGNVSAACLRVIPVMLRLGVKVELWLGEDDSYQSAQLLFDHPEDTAQDLLAVVAQNPGITGFNIDLEPGHGQGNATTDTKRFSQFLGIVTNILNKKGVRFTADVSCQSTNTTAAANTFTSDCITLGQSGVNRLMNMRTYNAVSYEEWMYQYLAPALVAEGNLHVVGIGLGCWTQGKKEAHEWSTTPLSAEQRICYLMNQSKNMELDMFTIRQNETSHPEYGNWPESFWIDPLRRWMIGGGCDAQLPLRTQCPTASVGPQHSWKLGGMAPHCCISFSKRGTNATCKTACAKQECAADSNMHWVPLNYSHNPFTCCRNSVLK